METLLRDSRRSRFVPVMLAEEMSLRETRSLLAELKRAQVPVSDIVVNRLFPENQCPVCAEGGLQQSRVLSEIFSSRDLSRYTWWGVPLYPKEVRGAEGLDGVLGRIDAADPDAGLDCNGDSANRSLGGKGDRHRGPAIAAALRRQRRSGQDHPGLRHQFAIGPETQPRARCCFFPLTRRTRWPTAWERRSAPRQNGFVRA